VSQPRPDIRLGIAGSGAIACGLARVAGPRLRTILWARSDASAARARDQVGDAAEVVTELDGLAASTVVVEAVTEDHAVKAALFERLDAVLADDALLATTTSSLSITQLGAASGRRDRFAGLHVFHPVEKMDLVELAYAPAASQPTRDGMQRLCEVLEKTAIEVPDVPGFVVNRLLFPFMFEAVNLLQSTGVAPETVDACMKLGAGHPMGPLALLDFVGLDVALSIGESIEAEVPARVRELVEAGRLGRKSGAGFFDY